MSKRDDDFLIGYMLGSMNSNDDNSGCLSGCAIIVGIAIICNVIMGIEYLFTKNPIIVVFTMIVLFLIFIWLKILRRHKKLLKGVFIKQKMNNEEKND